MTCYRAMFTGAVNTVWKFNLPQTFKKSLKSSRFGGPLYNWQPLKMIWRDSLGSSISWYECWVSFHLEDLSTWVKGTQSRSVVEGKARVRERYDIIQTEIGCCVISCFSAPKTQSIAASEGEGNSRSPVRLSVLRCHFLFLKHSQAYTNIHKIFHMHAQTYS